MWAPLALTTPMQEGKRKRAIRETERNMCFPESGLFQVFSQNAPLQELETGLHNLFCKAERKSRNATCP